jgi:ferredoxin
MYTFIYFLGGVSMAYIINDDCISCGACEPECPVSCISEGEDKYIIDGEACIDCGSCASVCPVDAPQPE